MSAAEFAPSDEQVERTARMLFARTKEGRDGFTWPVDGDWGRQRDLDSARRFLVHAVGPSAPAAVDALAKAWDAGAEHVSREWEDSRDARWGAQPWNSDDNPYSARVPAVRTDTEADQ